MDKSRKFRFSASVEFTVEVWDSDPTPLQTARRFAREFIPTFHPMEVSGGEGWARTTRVRAPRLLK
jgi:hypothetical protein